MTDLVHDLLNRVMAIFYTPVVICFGGFAIDTTHSWFGSDLETIHTNIQILVYIIF